MRIVLPRAICVKSCAFVVRLRVRRRKHKRDWVCLPSLVTLDLLSVMITMHTQRVRARYGRNRREPCGHGLISARRRRTGWSWRNRGESRSRRPCCPSSTTGTTSTCSTRLVTRCAHVDTRVRGGDRGLLVALSLISWRQIGPLAACARLSTKRIVTWAKYTSISFCLFCGPNRFQTCRRIRSEAVDTSCFQHRTLLVKGTHKIAPSLLSSGVSYVGCGVCPQDFSEDTYRTLAAADNAVMLVDAAKGLEPQTRKLFEVRTKRARVASLPGTPADSDHGLRLFAGTRCTYTVTPF